MAIVLGQAPRYQWDGLSSDTKPTDSRVGVNDLFFETDTGAFFIFDGAAWHTYPGGGGVAFSAGFNSQNTGTVVLSNGNGVTFGMDTNGIVTATVNPGPAAGLGGALAGTQTQTSGSISFINSNGVTFGMSNSSRITASVAAQTNQSMGLFGVGNTTGAASSSTVDARSISFQGTGGVSVGMSNGSVVISGATGGAGGGAGLSAGTQSVNTGTVNFANSNGITFGMSGSNQITASIAAQTNQTIGIYGSSQTTGQSSSSSVDARSMTFVGAGVLSVGMSGGSIIFSSPGTTGLTQLSAGISTGGNTSGTTGLASAQLVLAGGNNITLSGSTNGGSMTLTISGANAGGAQTGISGIIAGTQTQTAGTVSFANSNGVSFGLSNSSVLTGSVAAQTNQTIGLFAVSQSIGASSSSTVDARSVSFAGYGLVSVGFSGGTVQISGPATTGLTQLSAGFSTGGNTAGTSGLASAQLVLAGGNNITLSGSTNGGSMTLTISGGAGGGVALSAAGSSQNAGTVVFSNSNGVSFGMNGSTVTASVAGAGAAGSISAGTTSMVLGQAVFSNSNGVSFGLNASTVTASVAAQTNQTIGFYGVGNTTQNSSTTLDARTVSYDALGAMTVGFSNGSVQLSVPVVSSLSATGLVSISTNGSTISIGVPGATQSLWAPMYWGSQGATQYGNGTIQIAPALVDALWSASRADIFMSMSISSSSNSSHAGTLSAYVGLYTRTGSTLSLASSGSQSYAWTNTSNNSTGSLQGLRNVSIPINVNAPAGDLWIAVMSRTASANANWFTGSNMVFSQAAQSFSGLFGAASNASNQEALGMGQYSATSTALPASMGFSDIRGTAPVALQPPQIVFHNVSA